jgi:uncharacterized protein YjiS (DUF1127 family)
MAMPAGSTEFQWSKGTRVMTAIAHQPAFQASASTHWATPVTRLIRTLALWHERARERGALAAMDARQLKDIGLSNVDAWREANKPSWRP